MPSFEPLYLLYGGLALTPAIIWLTVLFNKTKNRRVQILIFLSGSIAVIPIFIIHHLFSIFPDFDFIQKANAAISNPILQFIILYSWVGLSEELVKQWLLRYFDSKYLLVQTINDSINLSLISALGFAFAENIFYFYNIGTQLGLEAFIVAFAFRSIFTICGHLVFSGFFGYYYGIGKFSISIVEQSFKEGKKLYFSRFLGRLLNISKFQAYQEATILKGLFIAIILHATYDFLLEMNGYTNNALFLIGAALFILASYGILRKVLKNRAGKLILVEGLHDRGATAMAKSDEEVVIELMGMWFSQGKYVDVLHICERLLKRDPNNQVVKLFKAKALDKMESNNPYKQILSKIFPDKIRQ